MYLIQNVLTMAWFCEFIGPNESDTLDRDEAAEFETYEAAQALFKHFKSYYIIVPGEKNLKTKEAVMSY